MKKTVSLTITILAVLLVIFLSVDIKKLDGVKQLERPLTFNPEQFAREIWEKQLPKACIDAPLIDSVLILLQSNPEKTFKKYAHQLGISKTWYFLAKGSGTIVSVEEEFVRVQTTGMAVVYLATDFIFGNALRDGSNLLNIDDFVNMTDFNNVSVELNKLVKAKIVSQLKENAEVGKQIKFTGAFEINEENSNTEEILIIPVTVSFNE